MGDVGLPLALLFSEQKFSVTGFDIDQRKVDTLAQGKSYIYRISAEEIRRAKKQGFSATSEYARIVEMDAVIDSRSHSSQRISRTRSQLHHRYYTCHCASSAGRAVGRSREYNLPRHHRRSHAADSGERKQERSEGGPRSFRRAESGEGILCGFFSRTRGSGNTTVARRDIPKVVGGLNPQASELAGALYGSIFHRTVPVSSPAAAEMTKLLENIYRCVNIALVNELKMLCLRMNLDIWEVIAAASTKPFGFHPFYPGPGLGGHCIPVDPFYLSWKAKEYDFRTRFIELAGEINTAMPYHVLASIGGALNQHKKSVNGAHVLILGVAYKKDIDDLRESPALTIIELLQKEGAEVSYHDPYFPMIGKGRKYDLQMKRTELERLGQYDCIVIVTDHSDYDYKKIVGEAQLVVDTRNATKGIDSHKVVRC